MPRSARPRSARPGSARVRDVGFAVTACAALAAYNNVIRGHPWHQRRYALLGLCATGTALVSAAAAGLTAADLGAGHGDWRPGRAGGGLAAGVAAGWLLVAALPAARPLLDDKRVTSLDRRAVAYQALVRIPVGTVLWEETAFRGVLQAGLRRVMPETAAILVTSGVFGIWHVRPTLCALRANGLDGGRGQAVARVAAVCAGMAGAGVLLSWLRARSGTLTAPVLLHLASNSGAILAAWLASGRQPVDNH
jgi:membrane protease YdiL (CAAX protease family)